MPLSATDDIKSFECGHAIHSHCLEQAQQQFIEGCPRCAEVEFIRDSMPKSLADYEDLAQRANPDEQETQPAEEAQGTGGAGEHISDLGQPGTQDVGAEGSKDETGAVFGKPKQPEESAGEGEAKEQEGEEGGKPKQPEPTGKDEAKEEAGKGEHNEETRVQ